MAGVQFVYELIDKISAPLNKIYDAIDLTDNAAVKAANHIEGITNAAVKNTNAVSSGFTNIKSSVLSSAAGFGVYNLAATAISEVVGSIGAAAQEIQQTHADFQQMEAVLGNMYLSAEKGSAAFDMIKKFAASTPYDVEQVTQSFIKMKAQGFEPTVKEMMSLGDIAASMGKPFDQLAEAVLDAGMGEFERLKEFGIKAKVEHDKVRFIFKGTTTEVANNAKAIDDYILSIGNQAGIKDSMKVVMDGLNGLKSNVEDNRKALYDKLGSLFEPMTRSWLTTQQTIIDGFGAVVDFVSTHGDLIKDVLAAITLAVSFSALAWVALNAQMIIGQVVAGGALAVIWLLEAAQWAWNLAMSLNPIGIIIVAIGAFVAAIYLLWQRCDGFRMVVLGVWETIKYAFTNMYEIGRFLFTSYIAWFTAIGKVIIGAFTLNPFMFMEGVDGAVKVVTDGLKKVEEVKKGVNNAWNSGEKKGERWSQWSDKEEDKSIITANVAGDGKVLGGEDKSKNKKESKTAGAGASGGGSGRSISVTIQNLVKEINIHSTVREGVHDIKEKVHEALIGAVRDFEVGISNS